MDKAPAPEIDPAFPRGVAVVGVGAEKPDSDGSCQLDLLASIQSRLAAVDRAAAIQGAIVVVKALTDTDPTEWDSLLVRFALELRDFLESAGYSVSIGVGRVYKGVNAARTSYTQAQLALRVLERVRRRPGVLSVSDLGYDLLVAASDTEIAGSLIDGSSGIDLRKLFANTDVGHAIEVLISCDLNVSKAAKRLFVHRNTLLYRFNKVRELTGLDPRRASDALNLLVAYHIYLMHDRG